MSKFQCIIFSAAMVLCSPIIASAQGAATSPAAAPVATTAAPTYKIAPGDTLQVFVWQNPDLSVTVPVRPDGRISTPLAPDIMAAGRTPTELGNALRAALSKYVRDPVVTVLVTTVSTAAESAIRIIGQATNPTSVPYHAGMTALDAIIAAGGLNIYAAGNRAELMRKVGNKTETFTLRLDDLVKDGDLSANMKLMPGDVISIPERWF